MASDTDPLVHTVFMLVRATPHWLGLTPPQRFQFVDDDIRPRLRAHDAVTLRFFDAEAFNARVSDVMMWQTTNLNQYMSLIESLRESAFWGHYFEVVEILPSVENGFARHYGVEAISG
jgi:hypothetical protein